MSSCPPIRRKRVGPPSSIRPAKIAPSASASRKAWKTSAFARSVLPPPIARAIADETPAPIPLLVDCRTSITQGNASEAPASVSDPSFPRKNPSNVTMPVNASRLSTFGADSFISVEKIGPSSSRLVRAAAGAGAGLVGAGNGVEMVAVWWLTRRSSPTKGRSSAWTKASLRDAGRLRWWARPSGREPHCARGRKAWFLGPALVFLMNCTTPALPRPFFFLLPLPAKSGERERRYRASGVPKQLLQLFPLPPPLRFATLHAPGKRRLPVRR